MTPFEDNSTTSISLYVSVIIPPNIKIRGHYVFRGYTTGASIFGMLRDTAQGSSGGYQLASNPANSYSGVEVQVFSNKTQQIYLQYTGAGVFNWWVTGLGYFDPRMD